MKGLPIAPTLYCILQYPDFHRQEGAWRVSKEYGLARKSRTLVFGHVVVRT